MPSRMLMLAVACAALARTAAPKWISDSATVMALGRTGFVETERGTDRCTCLVVRSLSDPLSSTTRWNPKSVAPHCFCNSHWLPHLMFYHDTSMSASTWGIGDSVTTIINGSAGDPNATVLVLVIPVRRWSNGESAMERQHTVWRLP